METKPLIIFIFLIFILLWEYLKPYKKNLWQFALLTSRGGKNAFFAVLNTVLSPLIILPVSALAYQHALWQRPDEFIMGWGLAVDILILDIWIYWMHRAMHEIPFLWRFHQVHHLDEEMDATSALRFHFGEVFFSALGRAIVIILFAIPFTHILVFETIIFCAALFQHGNMRILSPIQSVISRIIVTPQHHWIHHHIKNGDLQKHYATIFVWWDTIFGTKSTSARTPDTQIGIPDQKGGKKADQSILELIVLPFKKQKP